jgi:hypothetical protein
MKRLFASLLVLCSVFGAFAQVGSGGITSVKMKPYKVFVTEYQGTGTQPDFMNTHQYKKNVMMQNFGVGSRSGRSLGFVQLGSAGNLFTIIDGSVSSLAANQSVNSVVFIHRADPTVDPNSNVAQYKYDVSQNGGNSFNINYGVLNPTCENFDTAGRYPNVAIHVPSGVTNADSAYIVYLGTPGFLIRVVAAELGKELLQGQLVWMVIHQPSLKQSEDPTMVMLEFQEAL